VVTRVPPAIKEILKEVVNEPGSITAPIRLKSLALRKLGTFGKAYSVTFVIKYVPADRASLDPAVFEGSGEFSQKMDPREVKLLKEVVEVGLPIFTSNEPTSTG
jgi:hypothetical protein